MTCDNGKKVPVFPTKSLHCSPWFPTVFPMPTRPVPQDEEAERNRIGATIKELRELNGFKPDEFANAIGISRPYLSNIEAGRKPLTKVLLARVAKELGTRPIVIVREGYFPEAVLEDVAS